MNTRISDFFKNTKVATGQAFFNRGTTLTHLTNLIEDVQGAWICGYRRFGKTSLAEHACYVLKEDPSRIGVERIVWAKMDWALAASPDLALRELMSKVEQLACELSSAKSGEKHLKQIFAAFMPSFSFAGEDSKITMKFGLSNPTPEALVDALNALDELAHKKNARIVFIFDEFQELYEMDGERVEWQIRNALQHAKATSYIFAGSNRRLMEKAFSDSGRALYAQCQPVEIGPLPLEDCLTHLQQASEQLPVQVEADAMKLIVSLTKGHPRDFARLSYRCFSTRTDINLDLVTTKWQEVIAETKSELHARLGEKVTSRKRGEMILLYAIARTSPKKIASAAMQSLTGLSVNALKNALKHLIDQSLVHINNGRHELIEPSYQYALQEISANYFEKSLINKVE